MSNSGHRQPAAFGHLVWYQTEDICRSRIFRSKPIPQLLLKHIVQQSLYNKKVTGADLIAFLRATAGQNIDSVRQHLKLIREYLDKYYDSSDSAAGILVVSIPPAARDPETRKLCYQAVVSFCSAMTRDAETFGMALHLKYGIPKEDGEEWFNTEKEPDSLHPAVLALEIQRGRLIKLLGRDAPPGSSENPFNCQIYDRTQYEIVEIGSLDAIALLNRGLSRRQEGDLAGALEDFTEAIRCKPGFAEAFCNRGLVRCQQGDLEGGIQDFTEAILLRPDLADPFFDRGVARQVKDDIEGALNDFTEAIRLRSEYALAFCARASARYSKDDVEGAVEDFSEAIRLKPDYVGAFFGRGVARCEKEDVGGALDDFTEAIRLKPCYAEAFWKRGMVRCWEGDLEGGIRDFSEAIRLKPDYAEAFYDRGNARREKGDEEAALEDLAAAARLGYDPEPT